MRASYGGQDVLVSKAEWLSVPFQKQILRDLNAVYMYLYLPRLDPRAVL